MEQILILQDSLDTPTFYGVNNANILCLKNQHPDVRVVARGYQVKVTGAEKAIDSFEKSLHLCENFCIRNNRLTEQDILMLLHGDKPQEQATDNLILHGVNGKSIYARSINQHWLFGHSKTGKYGVSSYRARLSRLVRNSVSCPVI